MKAKQFVRICVDFTMFVLFLLLMEQHLIQDAAHEWLGISLFALFIVHNALNYRWYAALFKGKYGVVRAMQTAVDLSLWAAMIGCFVSSLMISGTVFNGLVIPGARHGAVIHLICTAWAFVIMSFHLGQHWAGFVGIAKRIKLDDKQRIFILWICRAAVLAICVIGVYVFADRAFYEELFRLADYKVYDYDANPMVYLLETTSLSIVFISVAYYLKKILLLISRIRKEETK